MAKKTLLDEVVSEVKEDVKIIEKAREKESKTEREGFKLSNRVGGMKVALWIAFGYAVYNVYSYTPLKKNLNEIFEEDFF